MHMCALYLMILLNFEVSFEFPCEEDTLTWYEVFPEPKVNYVSGTFLLDYNFVCEDVAGNVFRQVGVGKHFKGANDDTIRIISVLRGQNNCLVIATDTSRYGFGHYKFRTEFLPIFPENSKGHAVLVGDIDGDEFTDIVIADDVVNNGKLVVRYVEWDVLNRNWVIRDSICLMYSPSWNNVSGVCTNLALGDADNDGKARDLLIPACVGSYPFAYQGFLMAKWKGTYFDTLRVTRTVQGRFWGLGGITVGDLDPRVPGNEIYFGRTPCFAYWNGIEWITGDIRIIPSIENIPLSNFMIGNLNPKIYGNEVYAVLEHNRKHLKVYYYGDTSICAITPVHDTLIYYSDCDYEYRKVEIGDFLRHFPGKEAIVTLATICDEDPIKWIAYSPLGNVYYGYLKSQIAQSGGMPRCSLTYGVKVGDVNKWKTGNELILSVNKNIIELEERIFTNDLFLMEAERTLPLLRPGVFDTLTITVVNVGLNPVQELNILWYFKNYPEVQSRRVPVSVNPGDFKIIKFPIQVPPQPGIDTLVLYLAPDDNVLNNVLKLVVEIWDQNTLAASSFSEDEFPPKGWKMQFATPGVLPDTILNRKWYSWVRDTSFRYYKPFIFYPQCPNPLDSPPSVAIFQTAGSYYYLRSRLIVPVKVDKSGRVKLKFYMVHRASSSNLHDTLIVEYSNDGVRFVPLKKYLFQLPDTSFPGGYFGWVSHEVDIGEFTRGDSFYISFMAKVPYYPSFGCFVLDSVRVFVVDGVSGIDVGSEEKRKLELNCKQNLNGNLNLTFVIPEKGEVRVAIYDACGRRVATLLNEVLKEGQYNLSWDGRDHKGFALSKGIYFVRLETPSGVVTRKISWIK